MEFEFIGKKLFKKENLHEMPEEYRYIFALGDIRYLNPERDRLLLENLARNGYGMRRTAALRKLGLQEPPKAVPGGSSDEKYRILEEQILQLTDMASYDLLKEAAFDSRCAASAFAFCRLTGSKVYSQGGPYCMYDFSCGRLPCMTDRDVLEFCREMVKKDGPFREEASEILCFSAALHCSESD